MARPFKDIDESLLVKKYMSGATGRELAKEFGVCTQTIFNRLHKYVDIEVKVKVNVSVEVNKSMKI